MSDDQVEAFVSRYAFSPSPSLAFFARCSLPFSRGLADARRRYMPAYELFGAGVQAGGSSMPPWSSKGLRILVDKSRSVAEVTRF